MIAALIASPMALAHDEPFIECDVTVTFKSTIGFGDGHAACTELIMGYVETPSYKWNP